jgi:serine/threonine protein kinase
VEEKKLFPQGKVGIFTHFSQFGNTIWDKVFNAVVEKTNILTTAAAKPKLEKIWNCKYDDAVDDFAILLKLDNGTTFESTTLPLLKDYVLPETPDFQREEKLFEEIGIVSVHTLVNYPNYVEKCILDQNVTEIYKEAKMGIYASYFSPKIFVSHIGLIGEENRSIIVEKCESDLRNFLNEQKNRDDKASGAKAIRDILHELTTFLPELLFELERLGIIHGDIKPENIFVCNGELKLGDFGIAEFLSQCAKTDMVNRGTKHFESPLQKLGYLHKKSDTYSAGKTLLDVLYYTQHNQFLNRENYFPEPEDGNKIHNFKLSLRISNVVQKIDKNILGESDHALRKKVESLLNQYLIDWKTCI